MPDVGPRPKAREARSDVSDADYFYQAVQYLHCHGVVWGYDDGTFRPYNNATRGQICKIVVLAEGWPLEGCAARSSW